MFSNGLGWPPWKGHFDAPRWVAIQRLGTAALGQRHQKHRQARADWSPPCKTESLWGSPHCFVRAAILCTHQALWCPHAPACLLTSCHRVLPYTGLSNAPGTCASWRTRSAPMSFSLGTDLSTRFPTSLEALDWSHDRSWQCFSQMAICLVHLSNFSVAVYFFFKWHIFKDILSVEGSLLLANMITEEFKGHTRVQIFHTL